MIDKFLLTPFQKFVKTESFSGILLFGATIIALIWVNSPFSDSYHNLWQYKIGISSDNFELKKPLILWINDGLMSIFFFLIGLEIKRELLLGELNTFKKAALPLFAALGGMLMPMTLYFILNKSPETSGGWGVPMATDIAFSLAILQLLGKRIPLSLKIFLTAFAIVDDIGAVLVIAVFYSSGINWILLAYAFIPLLLLFILARKGIYAKYLILIFGIIVWILFLKSGIHPTVAGVLLAVTIPINSRLNLKSYTDKVSGIAKDIDESEDSPGPILSKSQKKKIDTLESITNKVQSPLQQLEYKLHNWVAYFIMPVFALSNAGVAFSADMTLDSSLIITLIICLFFGNLIGVSIMSFLSTKLKIAKIPGDVTKMQIIGISVLAGVGFTMSIFIANLAFISSPVYIDSAKVGILIGSFVSGVTGYVILRLSSRTK